jgi:hypothetical protein
MLCELVAMKRILVILALLLAARWLPAQGTNAASWAPLLLCTNGCGCIFPFQCGQMLQVGQRYYMGATSMRGYQFASWQQVKKAVEVKTVIYPSGVIVITTNTTVSLTGKYISRAWISFVVEPARVLLRDDHPGTSVITESQGWQANFAPGYSR